MRINKDLIWDYSFNPSDYEKESFKKWYIARIVCRGSAQDIRDVGINQVLHNLPKIHLPPRVRRFWQWYQKRFAPGPIKY